MQSAAKQLTRYPLHKVLLHGISQIMLQEQAWTGLLFLIGLFLGSVECGFAAILSVAVGTLTAVIGKFNAENIRKGIYGFSPALTGVALAFLYKPTQLIWIMVIVGSIIAAVLQNVFVRFKVPAYTFPFIVTIWALVFMLSNFAHPQPSALFLQVATPTPYGAIYSSINGFGQVIFQAGVLSGALFFLGVFISSPIAALYALAASLLGAYLSQLNGQPIDNIHLGLFGFNAVLTAIVFAGTKHSDGAWVFIGCIITIFLNILWVQGRWFDAVGGVFTFPFVAGTWITLLLQRAVRKLFLTETNQV